MDRLLLGISADGPTVGKSTVAHLLMEAEPKLVKVPFADALKDDVLAMIRRHVGLQFDRTTLEAYKGDVFGPLCQGLGELMRRFVRESYWIDQWADRVRFLGADFVIVDDLRHANEAEEIRRKGGYLIHVSGPQHAADGRSLAHASERNNSELKLMADFRIVNDGTLEDLGLEVTKLLDEIYLTARFDPARQQEAS